MASNIVAGERYETITALLFEIGRQLRQEGGYKFNVNQLEAHLLAAVEGQFCPGEIYRVKLGGKTTTDDIAKEWREADLYVNDYITQANFPLNPHDPEDVEIEVIDPVCSFSEEEGLKLLADAHLEQPTYEHALRFGEQYGRTTMGKKPYIIFLHKAWQDQDRHYLHVVCMNRDPSDRGLYLRCHDDRFHDRSVLAGVRPRKQVQP